MKAVYLFFSFVLLAGSANAQNFVNPLESTRHIEVTGEVEMEIVPDEIYLQFTLKERYDGKTKTSLVQVESEMKQLLAKEGFKLENLSLSDASADYITIKRKQKDVLASKDFVLKVSTTGELTRLWNILEEVKAENAAVNRVDHSRIEELKKEAKKRAMVNAKEKATYLLAAIDEKLGTVLIVREREGYAVMPVLAQKQRVKSYVSNESIMMDDSDAQDISFQKIKLNYKVFARFAIE